VAVKNHRNGAKNPNAQCRSEVTAEQVMKSTMVSDPLRLLDCSPVSDGAAAVIVTTMEVAKKLGKNPVRVIASSQASDTIALHSRKEITTLGSVVSAAQKAYQMANKKPGNINLVEVHDCFTIAEIAVTEDLGFFEKGKGGEAALNGWTSIECNRIPVNTSGGLKSKGHPVGATGIAQIIELYEQLNQNAGSRQVKDAHVGMAQNMGGSGASCVIHILESK
ncbi:MAG: thiolase domain-containing protein, partial [Ignavibacteriae bacterium]|nr:thiolase domain-containing protein [Ignavibacteriota bacterium]